ncbi:MAG: uroporphyrinogen-III C-methyltransferase [Bacillota bacterium]|nr:uroporphyrinogen-III C-methyltransferase [Bacillota bacterium]
MIKTGIVYLIGAGPGDSSLLTLKGKDILERADVVVYDRLVGMELMDFVRENAELIYVGKSAGHHAMKQEEINELLIQKAREVKVVARLKGGDPFVFGRGGEEAQVLRQNGIRFEVVPGVTSAIAVPAYAGIPVTHREATSSFAVITGHEKPGKAESSIQWDKIATGIGTLMFLMGVENLPFIVENLVTYGRPKSTPVAVIHKGTLPEQKVVTATLGDIVRKVQEANLQPPSIIIVGETVSLRSELNWIEERPLWGKTIVVTRARAQASGLKKKLKDLGGEVIEFPSIEIQKENDLQPLYDAFDCISDFQWLIFTSANAVELFFNEMKSKKIDIRLLSGLMIAAIGPVTCESVEKRGLLVDVVPAEYVAEGIVDRLRSHIKPGDKVLLPRARGAREVLPDKITELGAEIHEIYLYTAGIATNVDSRDVERIRSGMADYLCFTSSSTVRNFVQMIDKEGLEMLKKQTRVACIGPITAKTASEFDFSVAVMAQEYTIEGLITAILKDIETNKEYREVEK